MTGGTSTGSTETSSNQASPVQPRPTYSETLNDFAFAGIGGVSPSSFVQPQSERVLRLCDTSAIHFPSASFQATQMLQAVGLLRSVNVALDAMPRCLAQHE